MICAIILAVFNKPFLRNNLLINPTQTIPIHHSRPRWYLPFAFLFSLLFLYLAVRGVSWNEFVTAILHCRMELLIPAIAISLVNFFIRSQRWGILLRGKQHISAATLFWACGAGYMGNNFLPFRTGEIIRSVALGQKTGLSKVYVLTTALTERIIDTIFLVFLAFPLIPAIGQVPDWLPPAMRVFGFLSVTALAILILAPRLEKFYGLACSPPPITDQMASIHSPFT